MPALSRWMVRSAFVNFGLGFTIASLLLIRKGQPDVLPSEILLWLPAHYISLLVGWMVQLALGVAFWIFPRLLGNLRIRLSWAQAGGICLNAGVWLFTIAVLLMPLIDWGKGWLSLQALGLILQISGVVLFMAAILPRVRQPFASSEPNA
jgi:hypothetical protein